MASQGTASQGAASQGAASHGAAAAGADAQTAPGVSFAPSAKFDIFPVIAQFLDPHLAVPVLDSDFYKSLKVRRAAGAPPSARAAARRPRVTDPLSAPAAHPPRRSTTRRSSRARATSC